MLARVEVNARIEKPLSTIDLSEERVFWRETYYARTFDFKSRMLFWRFDSCVFIDCTIWIDAGTEQLAFTECTFKDCNVDHIDADEVRGLIARDNFFDRPLALRKADFDRRLSEALNARRRS
jgi:hypothetical protein